MLRLAIASLWNRRLSAALTVLCIAVSVALLLGVEKLRRDGKSAFANTISGTDLVVGARGGEVQLLLYAVFRIGDATANLRWSTFERWRADPRVAWAVPLSLGDSHRGYRVLGTDEEYFRRYRFGRRQALVFSAGRPFAAPLEAVLGADVARALGYRVGSSIHLAHGVGEVNTIEHAEHAFEVVGVLAPTGTPVDATVHVSLQAIERIHEGWQDGRPPSVLDRLRIGGAPAGPRGEVAELPSSITAFLIGTERKSQLFALQRAINTDSSEALQAVIPGVALQRLWDVFAVAETLLRLVSWLVVGTAVASLLIVIISAMQARRREMAVLRAVGATPWHLSGLLLSEAVALTGAGIVLGVGFLTVATLGLRPIVAARYGIELPIAMPTGSDLGLLAIVLAAALLAGAIPAWMAVRQSLADGLSVRL
ncbi:MAG: ABC transporter permease [Burkholderiaceae bacterium]